jgi:hypothetical protein
MEKFIKQRCYPEGEEMAKLRAWLFQHHKD